MYVCEHCNKNFVNAYTFNRHKKNTCRDVLRGAGKLKKDAGFYCEQCNRHYTSRRYYLRHKQRFHNNVRMAYPCGLCQRFFESAHDLDLHRSQAHVRRSEFYLKHKALRSTCQIYRLDLPKRLKSINDAIEYSSLKFLEFLEEKVEDLNSLKFSIVLGAEYEQGQDDNEAERERMLMNFRSPAQTLLQFQDVSPLVAKALLGVESNAEQFNANGSGWVLQRMLYVDIEMGKCFQLSGSCSLHEIITCKGLKNSESASTMEIHKDDEWPSTDMETHNDGRCFYLAIASYFLNDRKDKQTIEKYISENIYEVLDVPVRVKDISTFEEANHHLNCSINVIYKNIHGELYPVHISKRKSKYVINLLLFYIAQPDIRKYQTDEKGSRGGDLEMSDHSSDEDEGRVKRTCHAQSAKDNFDLNAERLPDPSVCHYALIDNLNAVIARSEIKRVSAQVFVQTQSKRRMISMIEQAETGGGRNEDEDDDHLELRGYLNAKERAKLSDQLENEIEQLQKYGEKKRKFLDAVSMRYGRCNICYNCFSIFARRSALDNHERWCFKENPTLTHLPTPGQVDEFELRRKHVLAPYQMFFDFEAMQKMPQYPCSCRPRIASSGALIQPSICPHGTKITAEQVAFSYCIVVTKTSGETADSPKIIDLIDYVGENASEHFLNDLLDLEDKYIKLLTVEQPMELSAEEERDFREALVCHICAATIKSNEKKVRDHDHNTGEYLGAAHNWCNLQRRDQRLQIPVFSHNFSGYDHHYIIEALPKVMHRVKALHAIPLNTEKFKQITLNSLTLKDSLSFMDGSLEKLVETLVKSKHDFPLLKQVIESEEKQALAIRKGVYPYEFVRDLSGLLRQEELPAREQFYSCLLQGTVSEEEYEHARNVWKTFACKNMADYTRLYVITDTVLLAEVILRFRSYIHRQYRLDPVLFISLPSLSKDIMLKTSKVRIQYVHDPDMISFFRSGIRGGLSYVATRYADIEEMEQKTGKKHALLYIDANSLYGCAMSHKLPLNNYEWLTQKEIDALDFETLDFESPIGYAFDVTLSYPSELHLDHSSYPLAPEHIKIQKNDLSPYAKGCLDSLDLKYVPTTKLAGTFNRREHYVCHGMNLKLYLELGMKLEKVHCAVKFNQGDYMRDFVAEMAERRRNAVTELDSMISKRVVNSVFGKVKNKQKTIGILCILYY